MGYRRLATAACTCLMPGAALAQASYVAPDGLNRYPGVTIFCANGTHVQPCSFGGGSGGSSGSVTITVGGTPVSTSNRLPVAESALDALIGGGALSIGGTVSLAGTSSVSIAGTPTVAIAGIPAVTLGAGASAIGTVSLSGTPAVALASGTSLAVSSVGGTVTTTPASGGTQAVSGTVTLGAGTAAIGTVTLSSNTVTLASGSSNIGTIAGSSANLPVYLQAVSSGGASSVGYINAAGSAMATSVKAAGALLYYGEICNVNTSPVYFRTFNQTTAPTVGNSTPIFRIPVPATSCVNLAFNATGVAHATGLAFDVTSGSMADSDTSTLAAANTVTVNLAYK